MAVGKMNGAARKQRVWSTKVDYYSSHVQYEMLQAADQLLQVSEVSADSTSAALGVLAIADVIVCAGCYAVVEQQPAATHSQHAVMTVQLCRPH